MRKQLHEFSCTTGLKRPVRICDEVRDEIDGWKVMLSPDLSRQWIDSLTDDLHLMSVGE